MPTRISLLQQPVVSYHKSISDIQTVGNDPVLFLSTDVERGDKVIVVMYSDYPETYYHYYALRTMNQVIGTALVWWFVPELVTDLNENTYVPLPDLNAETIPYVVDAGAVKRLFVFWSWDKDEDYAGAYPYLECSSDGVSWDWYTSAGAYRCIARYVRIRIPASSGWPVEKGRVRIRELNVIPMERVTDYVFDELNSIYYKVASFVSPQYIKGPVGAISFYNTQYDMEGSVPVKYSVTIYRNLKRVVKPFIYVRLEEILW